MIQITRKEQQVLRNLKAVMAAEQTQDVTDEMLQNVNPGASIVDSLVDKAVLVYDEEQNSYSITKEVLQVMDDDPEVEQAWEDFRAVQGDGSMTKQYTPNKAAEEATKRLEKVLFEKGRLTHMTSSDGHIWVTEDKVQFWKNRGWKEAGQAAVPAGLQA